MVESISSTPAEEHPLTVSGKENEAIKVSDDGKLVYEYDYHESYDRYIHEYTISSNLAVAYSPEGPGGPNSTMFGYWEFVQKEWFTILVTLVSLFFSSHLDLIFDILLIIDYFGTKDYWWAALTFATVLASSIFSSGHIYRYLNTAYQYKVDCTKKKTDHKFSKCLTVEFKIRQASASYYGEEVSSMEVNVFMDNELFPHTLDLKDGVFAFVTCRGVSTLSGFIKSRQWKMYLFPQTYLQLALLHLQRLSYTISKATKAPTSTCYLLHKSTYYIFKILINHLGEDKLFYETIPQLALQYYIFIHRDTLNILQLLKLIKSFASIFFSVALKGRSKEKYYQMENSILYILCLILNAFSYICLSMGIIVAATYAAIVNPVIVVGIGVLYVSYFLAEHYKDWYFRIIPYITLLVIVPYSFDHLFDCLNESNVLSNSTMLRLCNASRIQYCNSTMSLVKVSDVTTLVTSAVHTVVKSVSVVKSHAYWTSPFTCPSSWYRELFIALACIFSLSIPIWIMTDVAHGKDRQKKKNDSKDSK